MSRRKTSGEANSRIKPEKKKVGLRELAAHVGLSPTALSLVLNRAPAASAIPQETKERIFAAAEKFNYRPNYFARSLRAQRSFTLGVLVPELSDGYSAMVLNGVEAVLLRERYFYFLASHRHRADLIEEYQHLFYERRVEGIIAVDTPLKNNRSDNAVDADDSKHESPLPIVTVSGHDNLDGVTNIVLNHNLAAALALDHLHSLGHRRIAFIKGQKFSSDTEIRWQSIEAAAARRDLQISPGLIAQLEGDSPSPELGYIAARKILERGESFTALFAFNDISAIGAIRAVQEIGRRVPEDVSVLGFDDAYAAAFHNPALTTIRQPLFEMGKLAAETLLRRIGGDQTGGASVSVEPELIVRNSTAKTIDN